MSEIRDVFEILKRRNMTIGVMESCTGGAIASAITNIPGASDVFEEGLVVYSDKAKIKHGVDPKIIKKFGVYSKEAAEEMAKKASGDIGVGVTGELPGKVYFCVRVKLKITNYELRIKKQKLRSKMKEEVVREVIHIVLKSL